MDKYNHFTEDMLGEEYRFNIIDHYSFKDLKIHDSNFAQNRFVDCYIIYSIIEM